MKLLAVTAVACAVSAACGDSGPSAEQPQQLRFERWSPPQSTGRDAFVGARGNVVVMAHRISRDGGATWVPLAPGIGELTRVAITNTTVMLHASTLGLSRWDLATDAIMPVVGAPSYTSDRTWRVDPTTGRAIVFAPIDNAIAVEHAAGWTLAALPQPTATEVLPYVKDVESNGSTVLAISAWGIHRSIDSGASWQLIVKDLPGGGRDLLVLADRRFVLVGGTTSYAFDASGLAAGVVGSLVVDNSEASVCDDGAIFSRGKVTHDLGASWHSLIAGGDLQMIVERAGCGGGRYWVLARSDAWGYRLVRYDAPGTPGTQGVVAGNWEASGDQAWSSGGPPIVRSADGTFLVAGLAWEDGAPDWTLREIPARTWASAATLFGVARPRFFTSSDNGHTWFAAAANGLQTDEPEAFARGGTGELYVSEFTGATVDTTDSWHSKVWRSTDLGASWTIAYDATATRTVGGDDIVGEVHRFVGITDDGAWIATDAVSHDSGMTWQETDVIGDRGLAHLTHRGSLVTARPAGDATDDLWRVYGDGGLGELRATFTIEVDGTSIPASQLRSVAFDEAGHAYVARGAPTVQVWRSDRPVD